jgi:O-antigen/teichoic acid export membrane protein
MIKAMFRTPILCGTVFYTTAEVIRNLIPFAFLPILTRHLSIQEYGIVSMFTAAIGILGPTVGLKTSSAVARAYIDRKEVDFPAYVGTALSVSILATLGIGAVVIGLSGVFRRTIPLDTWVWISVMLICLCTNFSDTQLMLWRYQQRAKDFGLFQIARSFFSVATLALAVIVLNMGWQGAILAYTATAVVFAFASLWFLKLSNYLQWTWHGIYARTITYYSVPIAIHGLFWSLASLSDRFFISHWEGLKDVALYSLGYQLATVIMIVQDSFNKAWVPVFFEKLKSAGESDKRNLVRITYLYMVGLVTLTVLYILGLPFVMKAIFPAHYLVASKYIAWISAGFVLNGAYKMLVPYIFYHHTTRSLPWLTAIAVTTNIGLNFILIPKVGAMGAAYAAVVSQAVAVVVTWYGAQKAYPMPWLLRKQNAYPGNGRP